MKQLEGLVDHFARAVALRVYDADGNVLVHVPFVDPNVTGDAVVWPCQETTVSWAGFMARCSLVDLAGEEVYQFEMRDLNIGLSYVSDSVRIVFHEFRITFGADECCVQWRREADR